MTKRSKSSLSRSPIGSDSLGPNSGSICSKAASNLINSATELADDLAEWGGESGASAGAGAGVGVINVGGLGVAMTNGEIVVTVGDVAWWLDLGVVCEDSPISFSKIPFSIVVCHVKYTIHFSKEYILKKSLFSAGGRVWATVPK